MTQLQETHVRKPCPREHPLKGAKDIARAHRLAQPRREDEFVIAPRVSCRQAFVPLTRNGGARSLLRWSEAASRLDEVLKGNQWNRPLDHYSRSYTRP